MFYWIMKSLAKYSSVLSTSLYFLIWSAKEYLRVVNVQQITCVLQEYKNGTHLTRHFYRTTCNLQSIIPTNNGSKISAIIVLVKWHMHIHIYISWIIPKKIDIYGFSDLKGIFVVMFIKISVNRTDINFP